MEAITPTPEAQGETTEVNEWLSRSGLRFEDLGDDASSMVIRQQWRQYQAAVRRYSIIKHQPPERVRLEGADEKLRKPQIEVKSLALSHFNGSER